MAKKKRKKEVEAEKYEFKPPEFDEKQFLTDEMKATKRIILTVAYGALFGVLAAIVSMLVDSAVMGLLVMILGLISIRYIFPFMGIDLLKFTKKTWLESGVWFFFTFMALWVLMYNMPFSDFTSPDIPPEDIYVTVNLGEDEGWVKFNYTYDRESSAYEWEKSGQYLLSDVLNKSSELKIVAKVADNPGLSANPTIEIGDSSYVMTSEGDNLYSYSITTLEPYLKSGYLFTFSISAEDVNGHKSKFSLDTHAEISVD